jgi:hypothetical protein
MGIDNDDIAIRGESRSGGGSATTRDKEMLAIMADSNHCRREIVINIKILSKTAQNRPPAVAYRLSSKKIGNQRLPSSPEQSEKFIAGNCGLASTTKRQRTD